jgi:hypothetical protein
MYDWLLRHWAVDAGGFAEQTRGAGEAYFMQDLIPGTDVLAMEQPVCFLAP